MGKAGTFPGLQSSATEIRGSRRILVIGAGGSGKSTLARRLGEILCLKVLHLDRHYWGAGWKEPPHEEWEKTVRRLVARGSWIIDGNYGGTMDLRFGAADAIIFLDLPRNLYLRRVIVRRLRYAGRSRPDVAPGCEERITFQFLKYLWRYPAERRPGIIRKLERLSSSKAVLVLRSPSEVRRFVADLEGRSGAA